MKDAATNAVSETMDNAKEKVAGVAAGAVAAVKGIADDVTEAVTGDKENKEEEEPDCD
jgi:ribosomal protein L12E/L44/L45/RPP1/RPP2